MRILASTALLSHSVTIGHTAEGRLESEGRGFDPLQEAHHSSRKIPKFIGRILCSSPTPRTLRPREQTQNTDNRTVERKSARATTASCRPASSDDEALSPAEPPATSQRNLRRRASRRPHLTRRSISSYRNPRVMVPPFSAESRSTTTPRCSAPTDRSRSWFPSGWDVGGLGRGDVAG